MEHIVTFIQILSWIAVTVSGIWIVLATWAWYEYNMTKSGELEQLLDSMKGYRKHFPVGRYFIIFFVGLAAIIATWNA